MYLFPIALTSLPFYCSKKPVFFWKPSWCFLGAPPCRWWSWQRSLGQFRGLGDLKLTVACHVWCAPRGVRCHPPVAQQPSFSWGQVSPLFRPPSPVLWSSRTGRSEWWKQSAWGRNEGPVAEISREEGMSGLNWGLMQKSDLHIKRSVHVLLLSVN